jgi:hypothetical protein
MTLYSDFEIENVNKIRLPVRLCAMFTEAGIGSVVAYNEESLVAAIESGNFVKTGDQDLFEKALVALREKKAELSEPNSP